MLESYLVNMKECLACISVLLKGGADPNREYPDGRVPIIWAHRCWRVVRELLKYGANPNACDSGQSALVRALDAGSETCVRLLLAHGADPNLRGSCPPLFASTHCDMDELLLDFGADPRKRYASNFTAAQYHRKWKRFPPIAEAMKNWTPHKMVPWWSATHSDFEKYTDHCPGFRHGIKTLLLCLLRLRHYCARPLCARIVAYVANGHKRDQWWPIVNFSMQPYL